MLLRKPLLGGLAKQIPSQQAWRDWLREAVSPELAPHIVNAVPKAVGSPPGGLELVVLADSPAWCARLRYAIAALEPRITARDGAVQRTRVRVSMG